MENVTAMTALQRVEAWLRARKLEWTDFNEIGQNEDGRVVFLAVWDAVRFLPGYGPVEAAVDKAKSNPVSLPAKWDRTPGYRRFVSIAYWLQQLVREANIYLPTRKFAALLDCSHETISRYIKFAVADGILERAKPHSFFRGGFRLAAEFRFLAHAGGKSASAAPGARDGQPANPPDNPLAPDLISGASS